ncbi:sugar phosphate isomerase/epimerase [Candidatus Bathyarchaeota archaeon]|nr:sugar phosphate isomerase/epimerase [Candidatus Bathyarchaeota archaeon]
MKICIVTDEVSSDPETAMELISDWGVKYIEIRAVWRKRVPDIESYEIRRLLDLISSYNVRVAAISPGVFKCRIDDEATVMKHLNERLPRSIELAEALGTNTVIVFGFLCDDPSNRKYFHYATEILRKASDYAAERGIMLALENEPFSLADTGERSANLARSIGRENLRLNWDPCNAYVSGELPSEGYKHVRDLVAHVHLKDVVIDQGSGKKIYVPFGDGEVDVFSQVKYLVNDGYRGFFSIETHMSKNRVKGTFTCLRRLQSLIEELGEKTE